MKKLLFALLFANACLSQGFIEVEVRDTLMLKPQSYQYKISVNDVPNAAPAPAPDMDSIVASAQESVYDADYLSDRISGLEKFLKKNRYDFIKSRNYTVTDYYHGNQTVANYLVKLKSSKNLDELVDAIDKMYGISGMLIEITYDTSDATEAKLTQKIISKAKAKAEFIASQTNQKLGPVIEFREQHFNVPFRKIPSTQTVMSEISKTVIVKFKTD